MASNAEGNEEDQPNEDETKAEGTPEADEGGEKVNEGDDGAQDKGDGDEGMASKASAVDTAEPGGDTEDTPGDELKPPEDGAGDKSPSASKVSVQEGDENQSIASKDVGGDDQESPPGSKEKGGDDQESPTATKEIGSEVEGSPTASKIEVEDKPSAATETTAVSKVEEAEGEEPVDKKPQASKAEKLKLKDAKTSVGGVRKRRSSSKSAQGDAMTTEQKAKATRDLGAKEFVKMRRSSMKKESGAESLLEDDYRQRISLLSDHTMHELSQKPRVMAPPPSRKSTMITQQIQTKKDIGSKLINVDDLEMGGTRMSTLTDYLKRKHKAARSRSIAKEMDDSMHRAFPDGRPSLYEQYTKYTEQRINELAPHFTQEKLMEYRDAFYNFDDDIDGFIPIGEVPFLMRALCENPTEEELYEWISEVDADSLGSIDFADFLTIMSKKVQTNPIGYNEVLEAFRTFDNHNNGFLCAKELAYLMTTYGETLSEEELADMLNEVNINEDYEVPYIEFAKKITDC